MACINLLLETLEYYELSEECKLSVLSIFAAMMKRSSQISALLLERQIRCLGEILVLHRKQKSYPLFIKSRSFLREAFQFHSDAGLFVLLFKSNFNVKNDYCSATDFNILIKDFRSSNLYYTLTSVSSNDASSWNLTVPVQTVLQKIMLFKDLTAVSLCKVLNNLAVYIHVMSPSRLEALATDFVEFFDRFMQKQFEWRRRTWDISALFNLTAVILSPPFCKLSIEIFVQLKAFIINCLKRHLIDRNAFEFFLSQFNQFCRLNNYSPVNDDLPLNILTELKLMLRNGPRTPQTAKCLLAVITKDILMNNSVFKREIVFTQLSKELVACIEQDNAYLTAVCADLLVNCASMDFLSRLFCNLLKQNV